MNHLENPAHEYRKIAKKLIQLTHENFLKMITAGQANDLHFSLEHAIIEALKYVDQKATRRTKAQIYQIMEEFDNENGSTQN